MSIHKCISYFLALLPRKSLSQHSCSNSVPSCHSKEMDRSHTVTESSTKEQASKASKAPALLCPQWPPCPPSRSHWRSNSEHSDHRHASRFVWLPHGVAGSELLTAELAQGEWLCFDSWETLLSCVQLFCDPIDCSPSGSSVHGIL